MSSDLFNRYQDLQSYVGWNAEDVARVKSVAEVIEQRVDVLIDDFYAEIQRHPDAARVITGGHAQITRLMASLRSWLRESMERPQRRRLCRAPLEELAYVMQRLG